MARESELPDAGRQRMWVALAFVAVIMTLVIAYLAVRPLADWIVDQLHSQDVNV
jgi:NhaP-type Na+/H+ or K+/H+ antiporter